MISQSLRLAVSPVKKLQNVKFCTVRVRGPLSPPFLPPEPEPEEPSFFLPVTPTVSIIENNMTVISQPAPGPAHLLVAVKAGTRYEDPLDRGACNYLSHYNRISAINTQVKNFGAEFTFNFTADYLYYHLFCLQKDIPVLIQSLSNSICNQEYRELDVRALDENVEEEHFLYQSLLPIKATSSLFEVAFRGGIGNVALYCPEKRLGEVNSGTLKNYVRKTFASNRMVFCALGVDHETAIDTAKQINCQNHATVEDQDTIYTGGDSVEVNEKAGEIHVSIATKSPGFQTRKDYLPSKVLQEILGGDPEIAGVEAAGRLARVVQDIDCVVYCFNYLYSDSGLFGFHVYSPSDRTAELVNRLIDEMTNLAANINDGDVEIGKARVEPLLLKELKDRENFVAHLAMQAFQRLRTPAWEIYNPADYIDELKLISRQDIFIEKTIRGRIASATVGNFNKTRWPRFSERLI